MNGVIVNDIQIGRITFTKDQMWKDPIHVYSHFLDPRSKAVHELDDDSNGY